MKTREEFAAHVYKLYPTPEQVDQRRAMFEAYDFLTGKYDEEEKEKEMIAQKIRTKLRNNLNIKGDEQN